MLIMYKMSSEKRDKWTKKLDKMMDFIEEFKSCLEESEDYEEDEWEEDAVYRNRRNSGNTSSMRSRYSKRDY